MSVKVGQTILSQGKFYFIFTKFFQQNSELAFGKFFWDKHIRNLVNLTAMLTAFSLFGISFITPNTMVSSSNEHNVFVLIIFS